MHADGGKIAVFMDSANDGDLDQIDNVYSSGNTIAVKREYLEYRDKKSKSTALHLAALNGHADIVDYLIRMIH